MEKQLEDCNGHKVFCFVFFKDNSVMLGHQYWMTVWDRKRQKEADSAPLSWQTAISAVSDAGVSLKSAVNLGKMPRGPG